MKETACESVNDSVTVIVADDEVDVIWVADAEADADVERLRMSVPERLKVTEIDFV